MSIIMSGLEQLKRWLGLRSPHDSAVQEQQPAQRLMTLEERMAFRREMVFETVREVLAHHGVPSLAFKVNVARLDTRGHRYAVMVDLLPAAGRVADNLGQWQAMEHDMVDAAAQRYRVKISSVYWRVDRSGADATARSTAHSPSATALPLGGEGTAAAHPGLNRPLAPPPAGAPAGLAGTLSPLGVPASALAAPAVAPSSTPSDLTPSVAEAAARPSPPPFPSAGAVASPSPALGHSEPTPMAPEGGWGLRRSAAHRHANRDDFPDTVLEDRRPVGPEPIGTDELQAFEQALRAGQTPQQPVRVGNKTYQTDFMPLA